MSMNDKKSVVEEALLQMKSLENAISENAKGILASTMKEEISELVKESIFDHKKPFYEQEEIKNIEDEDDDIEDEDDDIEDEDDDIEDEYDDIEDEDDDIEDEDDDDDIEDEEVPPLDMTKSSDAEILKVFKAMGDEDGIIVKKDNGNIHLKDNDSEYIIQDEDKFNNNFEKMTNENVLYELHMDDEEEFEESYNKKDHHSGLMDETIYEIEDDFEDEEEFEESYNKKDHHSGLMDETIYEIEDDFEDEEDFEEFEESYNKKDHHSGLMDETIYEIEDDFEDEEEFEESYNKKDHHSGLMDETIYEIEDDFEDEEEFEEFEESYNKKDHHSGLMDETIYEIEDDFEDEEEFEEEFKESSRTLGNGRSHGRKGLPKLKTYSSHVKSESVKNQINLLTQKNDEYKKALNFFRNKLNEVAIFNSNLAYTTRLFTENSTTKQEKINILRRFDNVESIKESKSLYKTIKDELGNENKNELVSESVHKKITKTPSNGSSSNLIESKTYENPQFMRMKDLMGKIK